jgi:hypothetical protein
MTSVGAGHAWKLERAGVRIVEEEVSCPLEPGRRHSSHC